MAIEIERKFLVSDFTWRDACEKSVSMSQGYFATTGKASIRVRISDNKAYLNIKSTDSLIEREEFEYEIPQNDGKRMLSTLCIDEQIEKSRHYVPYADNLWLIDEFHGLNSGLIVAEIELGNPTDNIEKPPWIGDEITQFVRFYNHFLVRHPYSSWSEEERAIVTP